jgi:hypothetical protein
MRLCCPRGRGCNAPGGGEPCALALCRQAAAQEPSAALAVSRWSDWLNTSERQASKGERRFRRRGYERARDRALVSVVMRAAAKRNKSRASQGPGRLRSAPMRVRISL